MNAKEEIVASGLAFPEGPSVDRNGIVHLVELPRGCVSKVVDGKRVVVAELGDSPNGTAFDRDGNLYVCNGGGNWPPMPSTNWIAGRGGGTPSIQVVRPDGSHAIALTTIGSVRLNGPNDICFDAKGGYYFSDPAWAERTPEGVAPAEKSPPGDVCYVAPDGRASRVAGDMLFPNGLHVTPNGGALVVAETGTGRALAFSIDDSGGLRDRRVLVDLGVQSGLDGMCFDCEGRLLIAGCGSGAIYVLAPGLTRLEETIALSDPAVTNLCFGGEDFQTIFITEGSTGRLAALRWRIPGMRLFPDRHG